MPFDDLAADAHARGIALSDVQRRQFERCAALLAEWHDRANLVADASASAVERRHFIESLALGAALRERELLRPDARVLDLGAGAGFPGVPIKIAWPGVRLTLLEATAKKTAFLGALIAELALEDTDVVTGRAEEAGQDPALRGAFDLVLARAVAPLPELLELALPFARIGGRLATVKGSRADAELVAAKHALEVLGARVVSFPLVVPGPKQRVIVAAKLRDTPALYPRRPGVPKKQPL